MWQFEDTLLVGANICLFMTMYKLAMFVLGKHDYERKITRRLGSFGVPGREALGKESKLYSKLINSKWYHSRATQIDATRNWLRTAGFQDSLPIFYAKKLILISTAIGATLYLSSRDLWTLIPTLFIVTFGGNALYNWYVDRSISKRLDEFNSNLSEIIDLLVICLQGGLTFEQALFKTQEEFRDIYRYASQELLKLAKETNIYGMSNAFKSLSKRLKAENVDKFTSSILQSLQYGTELQSTLINLSADLRTNRLLAVETRAARLPAIMTIPLMLFILPTLFALILGPIAIEYLHSGVL